MNLTELNFEELTNVNGGLLGLNLTAGLQTVLNVNTTGGGDLLGLDGLLNGLLGGLLGGL